MMRVYGLLKARILAGEFAPGERLDPARLAPTLGTSRTPVRDALHRLSGERLVDTWEDEGFRQPFVSEPAIRDLYGWANDILQAALRASVARPVQAETPPGAQPDGYVEATASCFLRIVSLSPNIEHRLAIMSVNDRSTLFRLTEARILDHPARDLLGIEQAMTSVDAEAIGRAVAVFHERRVEAVPMIAAALRATSVR